MIEKKRAENGAVPESVALIMDGNGRWATRRRLSRSAGHVAGARNVGRVVSILRSLGVHFVTLYAFSTENWSRPCAEIEALFSLAEEYLRARVLPRLYRDANLAVRFIGDLSALPRTLQSVCREVESVRTHAPFVCSVALNYGGRDELCRAVNAAIKDGVSHFVPNTLCAYLDTHDLPDPDLLIRTAGERRLSNFLLYQCAYTELYFTDTLWPDLGREDILSALAAYGQRRRRFGGLDKDQSL